MRAALVILLFGCSSITDRPTYVETNQAPLKVEIFAIPPPENGAAFRDAVLRITFLDDSEYPDPDTAVFGSILLRSGTVTFDVTMHVSLVDHAIDVKPRTLLDPDTHYELVLGANLRSLSGRTLGTTLSADISVGNTVSSPSPSPSPQYVWDTTDNDPCANPTPGDIQCILTQCAPACHAPTGCAKCTKDSDCPSRHCDIAPGAMFGQCVRNPTSALDTTIDPRDPTLGMVGVASLLLAGTDHPLLRVQPGDSANSVLLRKLLGGNPHADSSDPATANLGIPGRRMPLPEGTSCIKPQYCCFDVCADSGDPHPYQPYLCPPDLRKIQDWIDQGAVVR
jgi:hypothetical protein